MLYKLMFLVFFNSVAFSKQVLIIGGNHGIGLALTKIYLKDGYKVYSTYRNKEKSQDLLNIKNVKLQIIHTDLLDEDAVDNIKKFIGFNSIDIMIYNAGMFGYKSNRSPILETEDWLQSFKVNTIVPIQLTFAIRDNILKGKQKKVAFISSRRASNTVNIKDQYIGRYSYRSSKAALNSSIVALATEFKELDITAIILHPGRVATAMTKFDGILPIESAKKIKTVIDSISIKQTGSFIDVTTNSIISW
ncbi:MAG: SDR family NAD(P)-dependent oxidoreductase [Legionellales bacterium]|nr:SDR family NAD(P)-dependent oxidoreductase [Legionellales bacterium]